MKRNLFQTGSKWAMIEPILCELFEFQLASNKKDIYYRTAKTDEEFRSLDDYEISKVMQKLAECNYDITKTMLVSIAKANAVVVENAENVKENSTEKIVSEAILSYMEHRRSTTGTTEFLATATEFFETLTNFIKRERQKVPANFPNAVHLMRYLVKIEPALAAQGLCFEKKRSAKAMAYRFWWAENQEEKSLIKNDK